MRRRDAIAVCLGGFAISGCTGSTETESTQGDMIDFHDLPTLGAPGIDVRLPTLQKLWVIDKYIRDNISLPPGYDRGLGSVGLILERPIAFGSYWNSPKNAITFAYTGGEGDHYSLLIRDGVVDESSPVVMTWPTAPKEHVQYIVGASLCDFLSFGLLSGFFCVYGDIRWSEKEEWQFPVLGETRQNVMTILSQTLNLTPWPVNDYPQRLEDLQRKFLNLVEWSEE
ncbi:MAG: hypothetical protein JNL58_21175 [Planctomyces sp.]|nr:hypothetical protein [Planctomyces sp.]